MNIKSESWQVLDKLGMIDVDFKIDVVETDCFVIPNENTMRTIVSVVATAEETTTTTTTTTTIRIRDHGSFRTHPGLTKILPRLNYNSPTT